MTSAAFKINTLPATSSASVAAGGAITAVLDDASGVTSTTWTVESTDDSTTPATYTLTPSGVGDSQVSFTASTAGTAGILKAVVNGGSLGGVVQPTYTFRARWHVPTTGAGLSVAVFDEGLEFDSTFGWSKLLNNLIRYQSTALLANLTTVKTSNYSAALYEMVRVDPSGGAFAVELPDASTEGATISIWNVTSSTTAVTVNRSGSDTINGATSQSLTTAWGLKTFMVTGGNWVMTP